MGRDIVATAKEFEDHAQKGYVPESLAQELHNMSGADRLAVAKQIDWDMKHQSNSSLPKIEFYDSGDLKSVETSGHSGSTEYKEHTELDKDSGKTKIEVKTNNTTLPFESTINVEIIERDSNGNMTHHNDATTEIRGTAVTTSSDDERWSYDGTTGKKLSHDEKTSSGKQLHEEYDATTGKEKFADETNSRGTTHRTYDTNTGNIKQEDIINNDKSHEAIKYNSNGDKVSREKQYGINGDKGTREWLYDPRTGKETYTEWRDPSGKTTRNNIDENGHYTPVQD
jgi:hypothetical protein